jgi:SAM-dependent methyltransferase
LAHVDVLTEEEYRRYDPSQLILLTLEACRLRFGLRRDETTVLDFGCGRGKCLCFLHERGYDVYGVDVDASALGRGEEHLRRHAVDFDRRVKLVVAGGRLPFPDGKFHFVLSDQVLEHVASLEPAVSELARVTRNGGDGLHRFPTPWRVVESHVRLPLVHWLPKTAIRRHLIVLWLLLGFEPGWTSEGSIRERADVYYRYTVDETFYRPPREIRAAFERAGFSTEVLAGSRRGLRGRTHRARMQHVELLVQRQR